MTFALPDGLAPEIYPLAWLVGSWRGTGVLDYPGIPAADFVHEASFDHDGGPYLRYRSTMTLADAEGQEPQVWASETGYWRVPPVAPEGVVLREGQFPVEVLLTDGAGILSLYLGAVGNGRIDLATDMVARVPSAAEFTGSTRMYGLVAGELLWAWDAAAFGHDLQSYASAKLTRVDLG